MMLLASAVSRAHRMVGRGGTTRKPSVIARAQGSAPIMVQHALPIALQLNLDLAIDELEEAVLVHLVVEVVGLVGALLQPRPRHLQLVLEVVPRMQHLLLLLLLLLGLVS